MERVDEALRADVMHWAAIYVRLCARVRGRALIRCVTGDADARGCEEDLPP